MQAGERRTNAGRNDPEDGAETDGRPASLQPGRSFAHSTANITRTGAARADGIERWADTAVARADIAGERLRGVGRVPELALHVWQ